MKSTVLLFEHGNASSIISRGRGGYRMSDVLTLEQRRYCMSQIRGRDTTPEKLVRSALFKKGFRFRVRNRLRGRPDIVFPRERVVVFVDGCFWHGCPAHATTPVTNAAFWTKKLKRNVERDKEVDHDLGAEGWAVLRVWEHEVKGDSSRVVGRIVRAVGRGRTCRDATAGRGRVGVVSE